ncbi:MAG: metallophosphoesterase [Gemmatimonadaceae bacterium]
MARWVEVSTLPKLAGSARFWAIRAVACAAALSPAVGCTDRSGLAVAEGANPTPPLTPLIGAAVLVGAGDIAGCRSSGDEATAALLDSIPGTVFTAGDNVYPNGRMEEYRRCYEPSWGRHRGRTYPAPGNHDWRTRNGAPYFEYFGARAGPPGLGYYSFRIDEWLILILNSNIDLGPRSPQRAWLDAQLAADTNRCEIVITHHPRFSSGTHGTSWRMAAAWDVLYKHGVELAIGGHDHSYERFAPMTPAGARDDARGVRQFVVGTGGYKPSTRRRTPTRNSQIRSSASGVLKLSLGEGVYQWEFVPVAGQNFRDWGEGRCR